MNPDRYSAELWQDSDSQNLQYRENVCESRSDHFGFDYKTTPNAHCYEHIPTWPRDEGTTDSNNSLLFNTGSSGQITKTEVQNMDFGCSEEGINDQAKLSSFTVYRPFPYASNAEASRPRALIGLLAPPDLSLLHTDLDDTPRSNQANSLTFQDTNFDSGDQDPLYISSFKHDLGRKLSKSTKQKPCTKPGCKSWFKNHEDRRRHEKTVHMEFKACTGYRCAAADCPKTDKIWTRLDNFKVHLEKVHGIHRRTSTASEIVRRSTRSQHGEDARFPFVLEAFPHSAVANYFTRTDPFEFFTIEAGQVEAKQDHRTTVGQRFLDQRTSTKAYIDSSQNNVDMPLFIGSPSLSKLTRFESELDWKSFINIEEEAL